MSCDCIICFCELNDKEETVKTLCGHEFHYDCLADWLDTKNNCPVCRRLQPSPEICTDKPDPNFYILDPKTKEYIERFSRRGQILERRHRIRFRRHLRSLRAGTVNTIIAL